VIGASLVAIRWQGSRALTPAERASLVAWVAAIGRSAVGREIGLSLWTLRRMQAGLRATPETLAALLPLLERTPPSGRCQAPGCARPPAPTPAGQVGRRRLHCEAHLAHQRAPREPQAPQQRGVLRCPTCYGPIAQEGRLTYCPKMRCDAALTVRRPA
jgi:hypothetical protein